MTQTASWLVGQVTVDPGTEGEENRVSVSINGCGELFLSPIAARQMATFLLLAAENIEKEGA